MSTHDHLGDDDLPLTHHVQPSIRLLDTELATSCTDLPGWWQTTKRMIERGSARFWARRGMGEPGGVSFAQQADLDVAQAQAGQEVAP